MQGWDDVLEDELSGVTPAAWLGAMAGALAGDVAVAWPLAGHDGASAASLVGVSALLHAGVAGLAGGLLSRVRLSGSVRFGVAASWLVAWMLLPLVGERPPAQAVLALAGIPLAGVLATWNASAISARRAQGWRPVVGWRAIGLGWVLTCAAIAAFVSVTEAPRTAVPHRRASLLVTVEGWHGTDSLLAAPAVTFTSFVAASDALVPATAVLLTGASPLRSGVSGPDDALAPTRATLATRADAVGLLTAAFVGRRELSLESGVLHGVRHADDRLGPVPGLLRLGLVRSVLALVPFVTDTVAADRSDQQVVAAARGWLRRAGDQPFWAWVHLREADGASQKIADLRDALALSTRTTQLTVIGVPRVDEAEQPGSFSPEVITVGAQIAWPGLPGSMDVSANVRALDVAPTVSAWLSGLETDSYTGVDLVSFLTGKRSRDLPATLALTTADNHRLLGYLDGAVWARWDVEADVVQLFDRVAGVEVGADAADLTAQVRGALAEEASTPERVDRRVRPRALTAAVR
ncbi:MAG: hypothetical protein RLZZ383_81 [Pseudomonadota bacterium]|jgi:hypothetical protein